jgi:hypothetical protein
MQLLLLKLVTRETLAKNAKCRRSNVGHTSMHRVNNTNTVTGNMYYFRLIILNN